MHHACLFPFSDLAPIYRSDPPAPSFFSLSQTFLPSRSALCPISDLAVPSYLLAFPTLPSMKQPPPPSMTLQLSFLPFISLTSLTQPVRSLSAALQAPVLPGVSRFPLHPTSSLAPVSRLIHLRPPFFDLFPLQFFSAPNLLPAASLL